MVDVWLWAVVSQSLWSTRSEFRQKWYRISCYCIATSLLRWGWIGRFQLRNSTVNQELVKVAREHTTLRKQYIYRWCSSTCLILLKLLTVEFHCIVANAPSPVLVWHAQCFFSFFHSSCMWSMVTTWRGPGCSSEWLIASANSPAVSTDEVDRQPPVCWWRLVGNTIYQGLCVDQSIHKLLRLEEWGL